MAMTFQATARLPIVYTRDLASAAHVELGGRAWASLVLENMGGWPTPLWWLTEPSMQATLRAAR